MADADLTIGGYTAMLPEPPAGKAPLGPRREGLCASMNRASPTHYKRFTTAANTLSALRCLMDSRRDETDGARRQ